jgi:hypothetical protein
VPIVAAGLIGLFVLVFQVESNCFGLPNSLDDAVKSLIPCCTAPLVALMMVPMGIYSVILGIREIKVPQARGKPLVVVAVFLGIIDIVAGSCFLSYLFGLLFV